VSGHPMRAAGNVRRMPQGLRVGADVNANEVGASASYTATASPLNGEGCISSRNPLSARRPRETRRAGRGWGGRIFFAGCA